MTHEEISLRTKTALADSLKKLMKNKTFSKITVSELIRDCNINRKTFYYHFEDNYSLLKWMLEQESCTIIDNFNRLNNLDDSFLSLIDYIDDNSHVLNCIYDSVGRSELKRFLNQDFMVIIEEFIKKTEIRLGLHISDDFRFFLCNLYSEGLAGLLINLFQQPDKYDRKDLTEYLRIMADNSVPAAIKAYCKK